MKNIFVRTPDGTGKLIDIYGDPKTKILMYKVRMIDGQSAGKVKDYTISQIKIVKENPLKTSMSKSKYIHKRLHSPSLYYDFKTVPVSHLKPEIQNKHRLTGKPWLAIVGRLKTTKKYADEPQALRIPKNYRENPASTAKLKSGEIWMYEDHRGEKIPIVVIWGDKRGFYYYHADAQKNYSPQKGGYNVWHYGYDIGKKNLIEKIGNKSFKTIKFNPTYTWTQTEYPETNINMAQLDDRAKIFHQMAPEVYKKVFDEWENDNRHYENSKMIDAFAEHARKGKNPYDFEYMLAHNSDYWREKNEKANQLRGKVAVKNPSVHNFELHDEVEIEDGKYKGKVGEIVDTDTEPDEFNPGGNDWMNKFHIEGDGINSDDEESWQSEYHIKKVKRKKKNPNLPKYGDIWEAGRKKGKVYENGLIVLKQNEVRNGKPITTVKIWRPKAFKPYANYYFPEGRDKTAEQKADEYIQHQVISLSEHKKSTEEYKQKRKGTPEDLAKVKVGDIYISSWGYDQTNIDFYQIVDVKGHYAYLLEIGGRRTEKSAGNDMAAYVIAVKDSFIKDAPVKKRKIQFSNGQPYFSLNSYSSAWPDKGQEHYESWYA